MMGLLLPSCILVVVANRIHHLLALVHMLTTRGTRIAAAAAAVLRKAVSAKLWLDRV